MTLSRRLPMVTREMVRRRLVLTFLLPVFLLVPTVPAQAQPVPTFTVELEAGPVWQSRNEAQIPNDEAGTRFSLLDVSGNGPWASARLYLTWTIAGNHDLRLLLAPLSITETGVLPQPVEFAGESFAPGDPVEATYRFNSWRLGYRYRILEEEETSLWVGFTGKIRDAKIELRQGQVSGKDTDLGFVPLLYLAAHQRLGGGWHLDFDFNGLAGGPGRAFDTALKLGYDLDNRWSIGLGYRTLEGGADVESVYNFAWLHYGVISARLRW